MSSKNQMIQDKYAKLELDIGYVFQNKKTLIQALTHSSYANEYRIQKILNNERLEFLGDAVLELAASEFLFLQNPSLPEGELTKLRASLVCEVTLAFCAKRRNIGHYVLLGKGEDATGGRDRASILSDVMEAMIGAIYLDGGFANAKEFVEQNILKDMENTKLFFDSKTILQEMVQSQFKGKLHYNLLSEEGPDHNKFFVVEAWMDDTPLEHGSGRTKKAAEQEAAYRSILRLKKGNG